MNNLVLPNDIYGVTEKSSIPVVSSRKVAEIFLKDHKSVLRAIENATGPASGLSEEFRQRNFTPSYFKNEQNKKQPEYLLTRDGFSFTAMGFTGRKADQFKEAYIQRFNAMEQFIHTLYEAKADFPEFTQAIMLTHEEPKHYHFSNELDMINKIILGMTTKQFKEAHGLEGIKSIRPYLTPAQAEAVKTLQRIDIGLILAIPDFQQRKQILTTQYSRKLSIAG